MYFDLFLLKLMTDLMQFIIGHELYLYFYNMKT
jgi:hypothetical protein